LVAAAAAAAALGLTTADVGGFLRVAALVGLTTGALLLRPPLESLLEEEEEELDIAFRLKVPPFVDKTLGTGVVVFAVPKATGFGGRRRTSPPLLSATGGVFFGVVCLGVLAARGEEDFCLGFF
jgi:hypothetical protein